MSESALATAQGECTAGGWREIDARIGNGFALRDVETLRAIEAELAAGPADTLWQPYYRALAAFRLGVMTRLSIEERGAALERAHEQLERMQPTTPEEEAEKLLLLGCVTGLLVGHTTWRKALRGWNSQRALERAAEIAPGNPRVVWAQASADAVLARPGSAEERDAIALLEKAERLLASWQKRKQDDIPAWGGDDIFLWQADLHWRRGELDRARKVCERALAITPHLVSAVRMLAALNGFTEKRRD